MLIRYKYVLVILFAVFAGVLLYIYVFKSKDLPQEGVKEETLQYRGPEYKVLGYSVMGRKIESYTYGSGIHHLVFVGGIHGGYEWNSVLLAYEFLDYLDQNPEAIPENVTVTVIPSLNPDGVYKVVGKEGRFEIKDVSKNTDTLAQGRFNANNVDINRNFDCKWKSQSKWRDKVVSAGTSVFSEPESVVMRDFVMEKKPSAVIFWHSQSNAVYASECQNGILTETKKILDIYSKASGYLAQNSFTSYEITGDAGDWLASIGIPSVSVELKTHETIEFDKNILGIKALMNYFNFKAENK